MKEKFDQIFGEGGEWHYYFAPGRVCFIGDHLDYNGGTVLTVGLEMGITAAVRYREEELLRLYSERWGGEVVVHRPGETVNTPWARYPAGVYEYLRLCGKNVCVPGADVYYSSNLPMGAGLSSSAALEVLTAYALTYPAGKTTDKAWLAKLCQRVENEYVGVRCGIMDQFSVALSKPRQLLILECSSENYAYAHYALKDYGLVVMNTNVPRELRVSKYNERRSECETALRALQFRHPELRDLAHAKRQFWEELADTSQKRTRYVVEEQERVRECVRALEAGDAKRVGQLMNESHRGLQNLYEVTGRHLDALCTAAQNHPACAGARMTGAGFGGCAIALVAAGSENDFIRGVGESYYAQTGMRADFYAVLPGEGVRRL